MPPPKPRQPPRRPPELMEELVEEILLRLPPDKPACLVCAALVCKRWCRLVTDPVFQRRFRQFHRTPPLLGFMVGRHSRGTHFLPCSSSSFSFRPSDTGCRGWCPLDARHGRVLFDRNPDDDFWILSRSTTRHPRVLFVWTPATGEVRRLRMPRALRSATLAYWDAALLCVAQGSDHMECPSAGPFNVVVLSRTHPAGYAHAHVYSSQDDKWSKTASIKQGGSVQRSTASALVGNKVYFLQICNFGYTEYDLVKKELSFVVLPPMFKRNVILLTSVEDGRGLGIAMVDGFSLYVWLRESAPTTTGGEWTWTIHRVVDLKSFPDLSSLAASWYITAAADAVGVFVIRDKGEGLVAIDVKSGRVMKLLDQNNVNVVNIIPYMSFCTPALRAAAIHEGPSMGASNN